MISFHDQHQTADRQLPLDLRRRRCVDTVVIVGAVLEGGGQVVLLARLDLVLLHAHDLALGVGARQRAANGMNTIHIEDGVMICLLPRNPPLVCHLRLARGRGGALESLVVGGGIPVPRLVPGTLYLALFEI